MVVYRTDVIAFVLDQLDFIECKLKETVDDPASQKGAVVEAGGVVPQVSERLWSEDPVRATQCMLVFPQLVERVAADWWNILATMDRTQFLQEARTLLDSEQGGIAVVRTLLQTKDSSN